MRDVLVVAAEAREFKGILRRMQAPQRIDWLGAAFARQAEWKGDRWTLVANGPGPRSVEGILTNRPKADVVLSTGFCGALDTSLRPGDIVVWGEPPVSSRRFLRGEIVSADRVAVTAAEKSTLRQKTGAVAVEMEAAMVARKAREWGIPFRCVRVVSDSAEEDMPLDFNLYRDAQGRFSRTRIALAALAKPFSAIPGLLQLDKNCALAAERLGEFLADSTF